MVSRNYLAHARVLAESFREHHPRGRFSLLLIDGDRDGVHADEPFELLLPADVGVDRRELDRRATMYATQGIVASLKPQLLRTLLARAGAPVALLDADGCVYARLDPIAQLAQARAVVLSPHACGPYPLHGVDPTDERWLRDSPEQILMRAGAMNGGLVAVAPGAEGFLRWWSQRTSRRCVFDPQHGLMLGQTWLTLAATLFDCAVLRDPGCNVAGWNLHARDIEWEGERPTLDGVPLRHFHFAGSFDPERPDALTRVPALADWWTPLSERPGAARLARDYAERLLACGHRELRPLAGLGACMPDGTAIEPWMREAYRRELMRSERDGAAEPPNPFAHGPECFREWLHAHVSAEVDGEADLGRPELRAALLEGERVLRRIGELELARDEAIAWAQRASSDLRASELALADAGARTSDVEVQLRQAHATMESVWRSLSWRVTSPLRGVKARLARPRG